MLNNSLNSHLVVSRDIFLYILRFVNGLDIPKLRRVSKTWQRFLISERSDTLEKNLKQFFQTNRLASTKLYENIYSTALIAIKCAMLENNNTKTELTKFLTHVNSIFKPAKQHTNSIIRAIELNDYQEFLSYLRKQLFALETIAISSNNRYIIELFELAKNLLAHTNALFVVFKNSTLNANRFRFMHQAIEPGAVQGGAKTVQAFNELQNPIVQDVLKIVNLLHGLENMDFYKNTSEVGDEHVAGPAINFSSRDVQSVSLKKLSPFTSCLLKLYDDDVSYMRWIIIGIASMLMLSGAIGAILGAGFYDDLLAMYIGFALLASGCVIFSIFIFCWRYSAKIITALQQEITTRPKVLDIELGIKVDEVTNTVLSQEEADNSDPEELERIPLLRKKRTP